MCGKAFRWCACVVEWVERGGSLCDERVVCVKCVCACGFIPCCTCVVDVDNGLAFAVFCHGATELGEIIEGGGEGGEEGGERETFEEFLLFVLCVLCVVRGM